MSAAAGSSLDPADGPSSEISSSETSAVRKDKPRRKFEIDQRHIWFTAPVGIALLGLLGTAIGASLQNHSNNLLERNKFEYTLIQRALAAPSRPDAAKELDFFRKVGLLSGLNEDAIEEASKGEASELPIFHGSALRDNMITVRQAKLVLQYLTAQNIVKEPKGPVFYEGPIDDKFDLNFQVAIMRFQKQMNIEIDGLIGPKTVFSMWDSCPQCRLLLQENGPASSPAK